MKLYNGEGCTRWWMLWHYLNSTQLNIDTKTIAVYIFTILISAFGWIFNSVEEIKSTLHRCSH
jgi:hypothetical protein